MFQYRAKLMRVVDGDTIDVDIDLGLEMHVQTRLRLAGLNAPERGTLEGDAATAFVRSWMDGVDSDLLIMTQKDRREKFGRYLVTVLPFQDAYTTIGLQSLNSALLAADLAKPWDGKGSRP